METNKTNENAIIQYDDDIVCPYCGRYMVEVNGKLFCENCGTREI